MTSLRARSLLLLVAALGAAVAGFFLAAQIDRAGPRLTSGTWLPQPKVVPQFTLTDASGHGFTRGELLGSPALVFFGFTHCPDVCPTTLLKLAQIRKHAALAHLRVVFVSIDPQRDTPPVLGVYVHAFDPAFEGLTGSSQAIAALAAAFGVAVNRVDLPGGDYTMDHSAVVFLINDAAQIAAIFTQPFDVAGVSADLDRAAPYLASGRARAVT
jgi:protein SCO1/2